jgi:hypothetical protein
MMLIRFALPGRSARLVSREGAKGRRMTDGANLQPLLVAPNRRFETSATCFDCCLSQEILDGGNGWLTT